MKKMILMACVAVMAGGLFTSAMGQQHVGLAGAGYWKGDWPYSGNVVSYNDRNVWIDAWVHNLGFHKEVGVLWSDNGWYTATWSKCKYELTYADGAERWGVDLLPAGEFMWHRSSAHGWVELNGYVQTIGTNGKQIEFVLYYKDIATGKMYWDNNNGLNHRLWVVKPGPNGYTE